MNATVNILCYRQKTLKNGNHPLMIRVTKNKKVKYKSLGISVHPDHWDFKTNRPNSNCPTSSEVITLNGTATGTTIDIPFNFENQDYQEPFLCTEQTEVFDKINEESGIQIHGILGNNFFLKHGWVLDFDKVTVSNNNI